MIEGNNHAKYAPTIEDAVRAENSRVIDRYARKHNATAGWVKQKLAADPDFLKNERNRGKRFALNDSDVDKNVEIEYNESHDLYTATDAFYEEVHHVDRSSFSRSLANRTTGMKKGETRTLMILGSSSRAYCFRADGYMHGSMICVDIINDEAKLKRREYKDGIDGDTKIADLWNDSFPVIGGKSRGDFLYDENGRETNPDDRVSADASPGNRARDFERSGSDYQIDERKIDELIRKLREMYEVPEKIDDGSKRFALSETRESVGKTREPYKPKFKERVFSAKDSIYIDTVDELYGVEKYLRKVGNRRDAAAWLAKRIPSRAFGARVQLSSVNAKSHPSGGFLH